MTTTRINPTGPPKTTVHAFEGLPPFANIKITDTNGGEVVMEVWEPATLTDMAVAFSDAARELTQAMARLNA
jgi:hypothetical protein